MPGAAPGCCPSQSSSELRRPLRRPAPAEAARRLGGLAASSSPTRELEPTGSRSLAALSPSVTRSLPSGYASACTPAGRRRRAAAGRGLRGRLPAGAHRAPPPRIPASARSGKLTISHARIPGSTSADLARGLGVQRRPRLGRCLDRMVELLLVRRLPPGSTTSASAGASPKVTCATAACSTPWSAIADEEPLLAALRSPAPAGRASRSRPASPQRAMEPSVARTSAGAEIDLVRLPGRAGASRDRGQRTTAEARARNALRARRGRPPEREEARSTPARPRRIRGTVAAAGVEAIGLAGALRRAQLEVGKFMATPPSPGPPSLVAGQRVVIALPRV